MNYKIKLLAILRMTYLICKTNCLTFNSDIMAYFLNNVMHVKDRVYARSISDACQALNLPMSEGTAGSIIDNNRMVWCPNIDCKTWVNIPFVENNNVVRIDESPCYDATPRHTNHFETWISQPNVERITFLGDKSRKFYFVGIFKLDLPMSKELHKCVWKLKSTTYKLPKPSNRKFVLLID